MHRKNFINFFILIICFQFKVSAQNDTIWFDHEWNKTSKISAKFFRPQPENKEGKYMIKDYYINGQLQMEGLSIKQDTTIFDGEVTHYYKSGATQSKVNYTNGVPNGSATQFFENGVISDIIPYVDGVENGTYKAYYENGNLRGRINFKNNVRDGVYEEYYENGNKKAYIFYENNYPNGDFIEYFDNGKLKYASYLENGKLQGPVKIFNSEGELKTAGTFIDNKKYGVWTSVGDDKVITRTYKNDILDGEITYEMNRIENPIVYYYKGSGTYENGKLTSWILEKTYKDDFKPFRVMTFENGLEVWKNYDDDGNLRSKVAYGENTIENGNWKFYYPNKQIKHDITFIAKDCYKREQEFYLEEVEETVIESTESYDFTSEGKPKVPNYYLPDVLLQQEALNFFYKCKASANGNYTQYYENGNLKLKATLENGKPIDDIHLFSSSNKKTSFNLERDAQTINKFIKITPIATESYVKIDYSDIEPNPFEMIVYYTNDYGESNIRRVVVHPILNYYISDSSSDSEIFSIINQKLNSLEHVNFPLENFSIKIVYNIYNYKDTSFD
nr:hypothetical protein [uncultured Psychroserpens sp.]